MPGNQSRKLLVLARVMAPGTKEVPGQWAVCCTVHLGRGLRGERALGRRTWSTYQLQFAILEPDVGIQRYFRFGA